MYFGPDEIEDLRVGLAQVRPKFKALCERIVIRQFKTDGGREQADHGLARRLGTMARGIAQVLALLPRTWTPFRIVTPPWTRRSTSTRSS